LLLIAGEIKKFTSGRTVANELTAPMGFSYRCIATKQVRMSSRCLLRQSAGGDPFTFGKLPLGWKIKCQMLSDGVAVYRRRWHKTNRSICHRRLSICLA